MRNLSLIFEVAHTSTLKNTYANNNIATTKTYNGETHGSTTRVATAKNPYAKIKISSTGTTQNTVFAPSKKKPSTRLASEENHSNISFKSKHSTTPLSSKNTLVTRESIAQVNHNNVSSGTDPITASKIIPINAGAGSTWI